MGFNDSIPIYVTRKNADGMIGQWTISAGLGLVVFLLVLLNLYLWGGIGVYLAGRFIFG